MGTKNVREVTAPEFAALVAGERPVLADFYATWCGPCKAMEPVVERLAERFEGRAEVVKVNIEDSPDLAAAHGVRGVPTFLVFAGGKPVDRAVGAQGGHALAALVEPRAAQPGASPEPLRAA